MIMSNIPNWLKGKWLQLTWTEHANKRYNERCCGSLSIKPTILKVKENNSFYVKNRKNYDVIHSEFQHSSTQILHCVVSISGMVLTCYFKKRTKIKK